MCSNEPASEDEASEYKIPPGEHYRHRNCTVRAPHQLKNLEIVTFVILLKNKTMLKQVIDVITATFIYVSIKKETTLRSG